MANIKIGSFNVKGLRNNIKRRKIFQHLHQRSFDIICLQECHCCVNDEQIWRSEWGGKAFYSHGSKDSRGTMILVRKKAPIKTGKLSIDEEGRRISLELIYEDMHINLTNIYAPNTDDVEFFVNSFREIEKFERNINKHCEKLIVGDFNLVLDVDKDKIGGSKTTHKKAQYAVKTYMETELLDDIWRLKNPDGKEKTWRIMNPKPILERLDFILTSSKISSQTSVANISPTFMSDHAIPWIIITPNRENRGRGFWILNTSLLANEQFCEGIREKIIEEKTKNGDLGEIQLWEWLKFKVREFAIQYSSTKNKDRKNRLLIYEKKLEEYNRKLIEMEEDNMDKSTRHLFTKKELLLQIEKIERDREEIIEYKVRGSMVRARKDWLKFGEKHSKYYLNLENNNYRRKNRYDIESKTGQMICGIRNVLEEQRKFYKELYKEELEFSNESFQHFTYKLKIPKITELEKTALDKEFTYEELKRAVWNSKREKVPGSDGLSIEFYQCFFEIIGHLLLKVCRSAANKGLHNTARQGIITLIEKQGNKNLRKLTNWRPLSLINCDGKIYMKMIALRLEKVVPSLIHTDQAGFLKGRAINDNLLDLISMLEYVEKRQTLALLLSFDFEKAFDKVNWKYLDQTLQLFGFGEKIRDMIKFAHKDTSCCTVNGGVSSQHFPVERGLRQGSPLSPILFDLAAEILACALRQNEDIEGIKIGNTIEKKLGQYADDIWTIIKASQKAYSTLLKVFDEFAAISGLTINYDKTNVLRIGSLKDDIEFTLHSDKPLCWAEQEISILGVVIGANRTAMLKKNYDILYEKMKKKMTPWQARSATLIGKITVINALIMSQTVYKLICLNTPDVNFMKKVKTLITNFLWENKKAKIAYKKLILPIADGGLKLVDLEKKDLTLKIAWVKKVQENPNNTWVKVADELLPMSLENMIECNLCQKDIDKIVEKQSIYHSLLKAWGKINFKEPENKKEILKQQIWLNSFVQKNKRPFIYEKMMKMGIHYVEDIFDTNNNRFFEHIELQESFGNIGDFIEYNSVISSIPIKWKRMLKQRSRQNSEAPNILTAVEKSKKVSKTMYDMLINRESEQAYDHGKVAWQTELNMVMEKEEWAAIRTHGHTITKSTKLQLFQFKLLSKKLVTNVHRNRWHKEIPPECTFCHRKNETVIHLLWECEKSQIIWNALTRWLAYICKIEISFDAKKVIINDTKKLNRNSIKATKQNRFVDLLILITKQYIYACKCLEKNPNTNIILQKLAEMYIAEKQIALQENKIKKFERIWENYIIYVIK